MHLEPRILNFLYDQEEFPLIPYCLMKKIYPK